MQLKPSAGAGNRHRADALERQADELAGKAVRGETGLARHATRTSAAAYKLPSSPGSPLPPSLRMQFEKAFTADFSSVRIHTDAAASFAAREHDAMAFTSGRDIYFRSGAFSPNSFEGKKLVAHELTHVLQQTGERRSDGRTKAADVHAQGEVQCQNEPTPEQRFDAFAGVFTRNSTASDLATTIDEVRGLLGGRLTSDQERPAFANPFVEEVRRRTFHRRSGDARGFVVDCLKQLRFFNDAFLLLDADVRLEIRVAVFHPGFVTHLRNLTIPPPATGEVTETQLSSFEVWLSEALRHSSFRNFWPSRIIANYRRFLLRPHLQPPPLDQELQTQVTTVLQQIDQSPETRGLMPQERVTFAWPLLRGLDEFRVHHCSDIQERAFRGSSLPTEQARYVLQDIRDYEQRVAESETEPAVRRRLAEEIIALCDEIAPVVEAALEQVLELEHVMSGLRDLDLTSDRQIDFPVARVQHAAVTPIHAALVRSAQDLFVQNLMVPLPDSATYAQRLLALRDSLEQATSVRGRTGPSAIQRLDDAIRHEWSRGEQGRQRAQALYVFAAFLDKILALAGRYDRTADDATPDFADERATHQIRMARALARVARWQQWNDLLTLTTPVIRPQFTTLWLEGEWEPDEALPPERLVQDFPENADQPVLHDAPLTARHISRWFRLDYNTRLSAVLLNILVHEERLRADTDLGLERINQLFESAEEVRRQMRPSAQAELTQRAAGQSPTLLTLQIPHRFHVSNFEAVFPPEPEVSWSHLIATHRKTRVTFGLDQPQAPGYIFADNPTQGVFGWILPPLDALYRIMTQMATLRRIAVRMLMSELGLSESAAQSRLETMTDAEWVERIASANITSVDFEDIDRTLNDLLERRGRPVREELPDLWRRVTILRRRQLVLQQRELLRPYLADRRVTGGPVGESPEEFGLRINAPQNALDAFYEFESAVRPRDEKDVQVALMILMLAPEIDGIITGGRMDPEYARQLYPFITRTIEAAEDEAVLAEMKRGTNVHDPAGNIVYIPQRLTQALNRLRHAKEAVDTAFREAQAEVGYTTEEESSSESGLVIRPLEGSHTPIYPSEQSNVAHEWVRGARIGSDGRLDLLNTGVRYRLLSINKAFKFHPSLGSPSLGPGVRARYVDLSGSAPVSYEARDRAGTGLPEDLLFRVSVLNQENGSSEVVSVHANDLALLETFYEIFLWRSFQIQMENLAATSEAVMDWTITAVGTILPPVAAADVAARFTHLIASGELEEIIRLIREDPHELFRRIYDALRNELFRPERVWRYLVLSGQHPFVSLRTLRPNTRRRPLPPRTRLGRIVHTLHSIGIRIADALERLRMHIRGPLRSAQSNIAARPTLAWILANAVQWSEIIPDLLRPEVLEGLENLEIPSEPEELAALVRDRVSDVTEDMQQSVVRLLEGIQHFELPGELLDLPAITELIIAFVLDRFGARARAIRLAMELIPMPQEHQGRFQGFKSLYTWVAEQIAEIWRRSPADPNIYWRDSIVPLVQDKFRETRDDLVDGLYNSVNSFLTHVGAEQLPRPTGLPETEVSAEAITAEAEACARDQESLQPEAWRLSSDAGAPLDPVERKQFETTFGASFEHVRIHRGAAGQAATEPIGADAVTSGSHIFLRPEAANAGTNLRRLLAHELTHVVQQTGITPPTEHPGPPQRGKRGRGLRVDQVREETAQRIADRVISREPLRDSEREELQERAEGIQPSLTERTVNDIIQELTTITSSEEFTQDPAAAPGAATQVPGIDDARTMWNAVANELTSGTFSALPAFLREPPEVKQRIQAKVNSSRDSVNAALTGIARLAQRPLPGGRRQGRVRTELNPVRFAQLLEGFVYGQTGAALQITLHTTSHLFERVAVINLSLARMNDPTLWRLAVQRSFTSNHVEIEAELRQRLVALRDVPGAEAGLWDRDSFRFNANFVADFNRFRDRRASRPGLVSNLPAVQDYTAETLPRGDVLAIGTHSQLTGSSRRIGSYDRQSHHTTQFLLIQYFENRNPLKAFPSHHAAYPGNQFPGGAQSFGIMFSDPSRNRVTSISAAGRSLQLATLDDSSGRGDSMPAILIAARTHQRGDLHILRESRWEEPDASVKDEGSVGQRATQGLAIENAFNRNLPAELRPRSGDTEQRARFSEAVNRDPAAAARAFYNAAVATYHWMHGRMIPSLEAALRTEELAYYRGLAAIQHTSNRDTGELQSAYNLQGRDLDRIFRVARANNNTIMSAAGWPTP